MSNRTIGLILFVLAVIIGIPLMTIFLQRKAVEPVPINELTIDDAHKIVISTRPVMRTLHGLFYQAHPVTDPEAKSVFFGTVTQDREPPTFVVHQTNDGQFVAIAQAGLPDQILILHDFATGESWPQHELTDTVDSLETRGEAMLARFSEGLSSPQTLTLLHAEGLRPLPAPPTTQPADESRTD